MKVNNIVLHIPDFMQAQMSLLGVPDNVHSLCKEPVSQLQGRQKNEEVGPVRSNRKKTRNLKNIKHWLFSDWSIKLLKQ